MINIAAAVASEPALNTCGPQGLADPNQLAVTPFAALLGVEATGQAVGFPVLAAIAPPPAPAVATADEPTSEVGSAPVNEPVDPLAKEAAPVDAATISSCLAMWQILPPPVNIPAPAVTSNAAPAIPASPVQNNFSPLPAAPLQTAAPSQMPIATSVAVAPDAAPNTPPAALWASPKQIDESAPLPAPSVVNKPAVPLANIPPDAAATAANLAGKPIAIEAAATKLPVANNSTDTVGKTLAAAAPITSARTTGIPVAKQQRAMPAPVIQPSAKATPAGFADAPLVTTSEHGAVLPVATKDSAGQREFEHPAGDEPSAESGSQTPIAASIAETAPRPAHQAKSTGDSAPASAAPEAARLIEQISKDIERMRAQGGQRLEVRLPMKDGSEVVVKLQVEAGAVKAVFQTESSTLRDALEAGWNQLASSGGERAAKLGPIVFEAPSAQGGMGGFSQHPDQRRRAMDTYEADAANILTATPGLEGDKAVATARPARRTPASGIQIYA